MHFEGKFEVAAGRERVYEFLTDPRGVATLLPDVESVQVINQTNFTARARVGISYMKGSVNSKFEIQERKLNSSAKIVGRGTGIQSTIDLSMTISLEDGPQGSTVIKWAADVNVGGLLASVGNRLLGSTAEKYIMRVSDNIKRNFSESLTRTNNSRHPSTL